MPSNHVLLSKRPRVSSRWSGGSAGDETGDIPLHCAPYLFVLRRGICDCRECHAMSLLPPSPPRYRQVFPVDTTPVTQTQSVISG